MPLDTNVETLLGAMLGVVAVVWSIGFIAYEFIYGYFDRRYLDDAMGKHGMTAEEQGRMLRRVSNNRCVYVGYFVMNFFAVAALVVIGTVLAAGDALGASAAYVLFVIVVAGYGVLFAYELLTTIRQMNRLLPGTPRQDP